MKAQTSVYKMAYVKAYLVVHRIEKSKCGRFVDTDISALVLLS